MSELNQEIELAPLLKGRLQRDLKAGFSSVWLVQDYSLYKSLLVKLTDLPNTRCAVICPALLGKRRVGILYMTRRATAENSKA